MWNIPPEAGNCPYLSIWVGKARVGAEFTSARVDSGGDPAKKTGFHSVGRGFPNPRPVKVRGEGTPNQRVN